MDIAFKNFIITSTCNIITAINDNTEVTLVFLHVDSTCLLSSPFLYAMSANLTFASLY